SETICDLRTSQCTIRRFEPNRESHDIEALVADTSGKTYLLTTFLATIEAWSAGKLVSRTYPDFDCSTQCAYLCINECHDELYVVAYRGIYVAVLRASTCE